MYPTSGLVATGVGTNAAVLPFTGFSLGWFILAGITLIAVGCALWRLTPRQSK
jgi:hypothetical protein